MATINLSYYKGEDLYSDGEIENDILSIVQASANYDKILSTENRWPVLYHLSPMRRNLLEWYDFESDSRLLEIGAGCGALTGLFCEKTREVVAIELSRRRAQIIHERLRDRENLSVYVGSIEDIETTGLFDYVTVIGVLEYAAKFSESSTPYHSFLQLAKSKLKPNGTLILAIENRFGIKYWAGAREDHTGINFDGIEGYKGDRGLMTFGLQELQQLLSECGFSATEFYYPMPDYKLPAEIFSDTFLPGIGHFKAMTPNYDMDRYVLFNEPLALNNIIRNGMFPYFANSFLVFARC